MIDNNFAGQEHIKEQQDADDALLHATKYVDPYILSRCQTWSNHKIFIYNTNFI